MRTFTRSIRYLRSNRLIFRTIATQRKTLPSLVDLNFDEDFEDSELIHNFKSQPTFFEGSINSFTAPNRYDEQKDSQYAASLDEETLIDFLQDLSSNPVTKSEIKYIEYQDLPISIEIPKFKSFKDSQSINVFLQKMCSKSYKPYLKDRVIKIVQELVEKHAQELTKETYVRIISLFHFFCKDALAFQILDTMHERTNIKEDTDFTNALMMSQLGPVIYKFRIKRLESGRNLQLNTSTWYYLFRMMQTTGAKLKILELMTLYSVPLEPVFHFAVSDLCKAITPEKLMSLYNKMGITIEQGMNGQYFNHLITSSLAHNKLDEAWELVKLISSKNNSGFGINYGTFMAFINHFLENKQIGFAFAFTNKWMQLRGQNLSPLLNSKLLSTYLIECPYFEKWPQVVKYSEMSCRSYKGPIKISLPKNFKWAIKDYAEINGALEEFNSIHSVNKELENVIKKKLIWKKDPVFNLEENQLEFIDACKYLGQN
ncbi:hypothetical protein DAMA08_030500 [Martiniozyma asiatica (nom. inval.)]|nr:hypothetical protein DAMA08_030500 [Martiniozyma asiatica]